VSVGEKDWEIIYEPLHAQAVADGRKQNAFLTKEPLKNKRIYSYVLKHLRSGWSPEQIAGRLKYLHPNDPSWHLCHETIYAFIYKEKTDVSKSGRLNPRLADGRKKDIEKNITTLTDKNRPLYEFLRRKQIRRRKRSGRKTHRVRIPDRVSIHDRPKEVEARKQFGHWEGDSLVGPGHRNGLHTEYERVSSLIRFGFLQGITAEEMVKAARRIFGPLPALARRSITLDNGSEHTDHRQLTDTLGIAAYFADPYSSWQRGGNENANLWIRYYFPKGTDFSSIGKEELRDVERELNNRPRKRLGYKTPREVFTEYLKTC
jgi:IS30 family transposase